MRKREPKHEKLKEIIAPRNPIGIIALFVSFIEVVATVSLKIIVGTPHAVYMIWFIILFPCAIASAFFVTLWTKREVLFGPMDFHKDESFTRLFALRDKVQQLEAKQEAAALEDFADINDVLRIVDKLVALDDVSGAIGIARGYLKRKEYDRSIQILNHMQTEVHQAHRTYYRILTNLAYNFIGKKQFQEAIEYLLKARSQAENSFQPWHALALAYAYYKTGNNTEYEQWLKHAKIMGGHIIETDYFIRLYPEIEHDLKKK